MGPTIMIGLGGVGSQIVAMAEERLFSLPQDSYEKMRPLLQFAIVDTDVSALRERKRKGFQGTVVRISDNMTVEKYLHYDKDASEWFPPCQILSRKTMTEGAGQVRAVSRLALNLELQKQDSFKGLYDAIDKLHLLSESNSDQPTRVVIVSSLAGGTGSGIFLPFAMHLQEYLKRNYRNTEPIFKGFFIMPSMFEEVARGAEMRSLNANAYAAIKELNAFTMMQDCQIEAWQYPDLKIELCSGNGLKQTYLKSPYDLCFLFEKQNQDDKHLDGFEMSKQNVANCVWMQTMNPVLEQNGSLEDNLFKIVSTSSQNKRYNRFAGMGIAQLVYPYQKLAPYFAMVMADEVVGLDWSAADADWLEDQQEREEEDLDALSMSEEEHYINFAENKSAWEPLIAPVSQERWVEGYLAAVEALVKDRYDQNQGDALTRCKARLDSLRKGNNREGWSRDRVALLKDDYDRIMQEHPGVLVKNRDVLKRKLLYGFEPNKKRQKLEEYQIEYWLLPKNGPGTPPENRYFLALVMRELEKRCREQEEKGNEKQNEGRNYEPTIKQLQEKSASRIKWATEVRKCAQSLGQALDAIDESFRIELLLEVYQELLDMVKSIWQTYKALLQKYRDWTKSEKAAMRKNLVDSFQSKDGRPVRFVCASEDCLVQMEKIVRDSVRDKDYGSDFARELCVEALQQRNMGQDAKAGKLKAYWEEQFLKAAGSKLDVDVLTALENEACWSYEKEHQTPLSKDDSHYNNIVKSYMEVKAFQKVRDIFVRAFLRIPNIRQRHTLEMCIYPPEIPKENVLLQEIVKEQLEKDHGVENGQGDSQEKYHIDFYRAVFGVSAGEVSTLLYEEENAPIPSGDGHNDYAAMIQALDWQKRRSNFLTPHIDRRWHKTTAMPELSVEYGNRRASDLLLAVFFGLWSQKIRLEDGIYKIGILNGQDYGRSEDKINNFDQLVDTVDESPAISAALLDELKGRGLKTDVHGGHMTEADFSSVVDKAIEEYCGKKLQQDFGEDELAYVMVQALLRLVYGIWIKDSCRKVGAAVTAAREQLDPMLSDKDDSLGIKDRMKELLTEDKLKLWLETEIIK